MAGSKSPWVSEDIILKIIDDSNLLKNSYVH